MKFFNFQQFWWWNLHSVNLWFWPVFSLFFYFVFLTSAWVLLPWRAWPVLVHCQRAFSLVLGRFPLPNYVHCFHVACIFTIFGKLCLPSLRYHVENLEFDPTPVIQNQKREYLPAQRIYSHRLWLPFRIPSRSIIPLDKLREKKHAWWANEKTNQCFRFSTSSKTSPKSLPHL